MSSASISIEQRLQQPALGRVSDNSAHASSIVSKHMLSHFHVALTHPKPCLEASQYTVYPSCPDGSVRTGVEVNFVLVHRSFDDMPLTI